MLYLCMFNFKSHIGKGFSGFSIEEYLEKCPEYSALSEEVRNKYNLADIDVWASNFEIDWGMELDTNDWGVKDFAVSIKRVNGNITIRLIGEEDLKIPDHDFDVAFDTEKFKINNFRKYEDKDSWMINNDALDKELKMAIVPVSVEIDFSEKVISVNF